MELSDKGKRELALALLLGVDLAVFKQMFELADYIGVRKELEQLNKELLIPFKITMG